MTEVEFSTTEAKRRALVLLILSVVITLACSFWVASFSGIDLFELPEDRTKEAFFSFAGTKEPFPFLIRMLTDWIFFGLGLCVFVGGFYNFILGKPFSYLIFAVAFLTIITTSILQSLSMSRLIYSGDSPKTHLVFAWFFLRYITLICLSIGALFSLKPTKSSFIASLFFFILTLSTFVFYNLFSSKAFHLLFSKNFLTVNMFYLPLFFWIVLVCPLFLWHFRKAPSYFSLALLLSVIPQVGIEISLILNKRVVFFSGFSGVHLLEVLSLLISFLGLSYDHFGFYRALEKEKLNTSRATESKLFFLSTVAEDVRLSLSNLHAHASTFSKEEDPQKQQAIYGIKTSSQQVETLLENLLTFSSLEKEGIVIRKKKVSLKELLYDCLILIDMGEKEKDLGDQEIETDPKLLKQVMINTLALFKKTPFQITLEKNHLNFEGKETPWNKETVAEITKPFQEKQASKADLLKDQLATNFSVKIMKTLGGKYIIEGSENFFKVTITLPTEQEGGK